jgi:hypothetical protein
MSGQSPGNISAAECVSTTSATSSESPASCSTRRTSWEGLSRRIAFTNLSARNSASAKVEGCRTCLRLQRIVWHH